MVRQLGLRELLRGVAHDLRLGPSWHRQHDVERFAPLASLRDAGTTAAPSVRQVAQRVTAQAHLAAIVLERQPTGLADVAQVRRGHGHSSAAAGYVAVLSDWEMDGEARRESAVDVSCDDK